MKPAIGELDAPLPLLDVGCESWATPGVPAFG